MISPVSSVSFGENQNEIQFLINRDGKYAIKPSQVVTPESEPKQKKSHKALYITLGTILGLGIIAGSMGYAFKNGNLRRIENPDTFKEKCMDKLAALGEKFKDWGEKFINLFKRNKKNAPTPKPED